MKENFFKKILTGLLIGITSGLIVWILTVFFFKQFFYRIEAPAYDWRMKRVVESPPSPIDDIVIIDVDERSLQKLGSYHHWPREYWMKLINYLNNTNVSMIGLDVIFDPNYRHPEDDLNFQRAIKSAGNVCSAFYLSQADPEHFRRFMANEPEGLDYNKFIWTIPDNLFARIIPQDRFEPEYPEFLNASMTAGYVNLFPDPDGVLRRIPTFLRFNQNVYPCFALQMALKLKKISKIEYDEDRFDLLLVDQENRITSVPIDSKGNMLIRYIGGFKSFRYISFYDVLMGFVQSEYFADKIILVGSSLPGMFDLRATPLQPAFPGVEINANVLYQLLNNRFIYQVSNLDNFLLILGFGILAGFIFIFPRPIGSVVVTVFLIFLIVLAGIYTLEELSLWMPIIPPIFATIVAFTLTYVYRYIFEEKGKREIRKIFSHYVSPSVVDIMLKNPEKVKLGGEKKICTVLFSDIAGFTTIAEKMEPDKLVHSLNDYLTAMTNIILENKGMLDKYEGDAIMAVFGAPVELKKHTHLACISALKMLKQSEILNEYWHKIHHPEFHTRIGINSGEMIVGNMGSDTLFDYTVLGDEVNLGSRLEGANKKYGSRIIISEHTYNLVKDDFITRPLDLLRVMGKKKPVWVYELIAEREEKISLEYSNMLDEFNKGFNCYRQRDWNGSLRHFQNAMQNIVDDGPSKLYVKRCHKFLENPPPEDWDGVHDMREK